MTTGVLLANMGGPQSEEDMQVFLKRMFLDPQILPVPHLIRKFLAKKISQSRYKASWEKYQLIGGTPIVKNTQATANKLQESLGKNYKIEIAFSYTNPLISESLEQLVAQNCTKIIVLPLYPQASFTTTQSVIDDVKKCKNITKKIPVHIVPEFHNNKNYLLFWETLIQQQIEQLNFKTPHLIYSAHSIPVSVAQKGDSYPDTIAETAKIIAGNLGVEYSVAYQSKMGKVKWLGPDTKEFLSKIEDKENAEILLVPVSFVSENLETLYDMDTDIIPYAKKIGFKNIARVTIPATHILMTEAFKELIITTSLKTKQEEHNTKF